MRTTKQLPTFAKSRFCKASKVAAATNRRLRFQMEDQIFPLQMVDKALICLDPDGRTFPRTRVLG
jgi:hypothetical protein